MKKSFKKAGAAVLSMAMLLSMGAMSMPVYAELDAHQTVVPTQVAVTIAKSGTGINGGDANGDGSVALQDDLRHHYDYLTDINEADVYMYRVATLTGSGWAWDPALTTLASNNDVLKDFEKLLQKTSDGLTVDTTGTATVPLASSEELQALAGALQQAVDSANMTEIAKETIHKTTTGWETIYLPTDDNLFNTDGNGNPDTATTTMNTIGYYLLVTNTDEVGYVMQPVLVPISNKVTAANGRNVKNISLKGVKVDVDKSIVDISTRVDATDTVMKNDDAAAKTYVSRDNISSDGDRGIIDADDVVRYRIKADIPRYSKLNTTFSYKIEDLPDDGIEVISRVDATTGYVTGAQTSTSQAKNGKIVVTYSTDNDYSTTSDNVVLEEYTDYVVTANASDTSTKKGFTITFTAGQLRGMGTTALGAVDSNGDPVASTSTTMNGSTMEGGHVFVDFYAKTNDHFDSSYEANTALLDDATLSDITYDDVAAMIPVAKNDVAAETVAKAKSAVSDEGLASIHAGTANASLTALYTGASLNSSTDADVDIVRTAAYLALSAEQRRRDGLNEQTKNANYALNGTENKAKATFNKWFTTSEETTISEDVTQLFAAKLDLTKVTLENNVAIGGASKNLVVTGVTTSNSLDDAMKVNNQPVMLKSGKSYLTTLDSTEAASPAVYVKAISTGAEGESGVTAVTEDSKTVYMTTSEGITTNDGTATNIKTTIVEDGTFGDSIEHTTPVQGAVFKLEETFANDLAVSGERVAGNAGTHKRSLAITDVNGKLYVLEQVATAVAAANLPTVSNTVTPGSSDIVYCEEILDGDGKGTGTYNTYKVTNSLAWDRIGEGTYVLTEEKAPAGYKKWKSPVTITITDLQSDIRGDFQATVASDGFWATNAGTRASATTTSVFKVSEDPDHLGRLQEYILNEPDDTLPATGGMGTVLFTAGGISIVLIAGALFVMYMKKRNAEDEE